MRKEEDWLVAPLTFFEMKMEMDLDPVELGEPAFGEAPESFNPIDGGRGLG